MRKLSRQYLSSTLRKVKSVLSPLAFPSLEGRSVCRHFHVNGMFWLSYAWLTTGAGKRLFSLQYRQTFEEEKETIFWKMFNAIGLSF